MGKNKRQKKKAESAPSPVPQAPQSNWRRYLLAGCLLAVGLAGWHVYSSRAASVNTDKPTFARDVAPLVYTRCAGCHHAGGSAPFPLIGYADVSKHAAQIVKVTQRRFMPPWLPEHGYGEFQGERYLSDDEILMLKNWNAQGAAEGDMTRLPKAPQFSDDWQLGKPDLVVQLPSAYTLPAEGRDVYRNFAVPIPIAEDKFVKGVEFRAGTAAIHHAFMFVDRTTASRRLDAGPPSPGWEGMSTLPQSARAPSAQFTSWQPGKTAHMHEEMAWRLSKDTDLVLQLHMRPDGKAEPIQPSVAFYFTDHKGEVQPTIVLLRSVAMDIPAGEKAYAVRAQYTLPIGVDVLGVLPHVHYLGHDLRGFATLPDGSRKWLLWIKNWDFNWQGDYVFAQPVFIPKGSRLEMEYTFDNSAGNPFNPSIPPKRVRYGSQSSDEMAELWLQLLPHDAKDAPVLQADREKTDMADCIADNNALLRLDSSNAHAHLQLGKLFMATGQLEEAETHLRSAVKFDGGNSEAHYYLGYFLQDRAKLGESIFEYQRAVQLDRKNYEALTALGSALLQEGNARDAEAALLEAQRVHPGDPLIEENLAQARKALGK